VLTYSLYRFFWCQALSAISSGRFGPVATEASLQVLQRPSPKDLRFALFSSSFNGFVNKGSKDRTVVLLDGTAYYVSGFMI